MPDPVHVPDIPGPYRQLCWQQDPVRLLRCDRVRNHNGLHTWEWAAITTALNCETVEGALHHIGALKQTLAKAEAELAAAERGCYVVERPDAEELAACRAWWERYSFTPETAAGVPIPGPGLYGLLAWWAYEREHERLVEAEAELAAARTVLFPAQPKTKRP